MTNYRLEQYAKMIVEELAARLDKERIQREIDAPIDRILETFEYDSSRPFSQEFFHEIIGRFVGEVLRNALRLKRDLSQSEAIAEAVYILNNYQGQGTTGYGVAMYDACQPERNGLYQVLEQIAALIKQDERDKYVRWVLAASWDSSDWATKCLVTRYLAKALALFPSGPTFEMPIGQLAEDWNWLLDLYLDPERLLEDAARRNRLFAHR